MNDVRQKRLLFHDRISDAYQSTTQTTPYIASYHPDIFSASTFRLFFVFLFTAERLKPCRSSVYTSITTRPRLDLRSGQRNFKNYFHRYVFKWVYARACSHVRLTHRIVVAAMWSRRLLGRLRVFTDDKFTVTIVNVASVVTCCFLFLRTGRFSRYWNPRNCLFCYH